MSEREGELDAVQKTLTDTEKKLDFAVMEKKAMLQANARIQISFDKLRLDNEVSGRETRGYNGLWFHKQAIPHFMQMDPEAIYIS